MALLISLSVLSALLMAAILVQGRGTSLGLSLGGNSDVYRTRRGIERKLHLGTIALAVAFFVVALITSLS